MQPIHSGAWRPSVTLSYAQTLDGSIAATPAQPLAMSSPAALRLTHELRARHDAILVGIGTILADDPRLTVRLVEGRHPTPVILDSRLRCPTNARFLRAGASRPIIATSPLAPANRAQELEAAGALILRVPLAEDAEADAPRVSLPALLAGLHAQGIRSVMVEGGAGVITSFLAARLVDEVVLTVVPAFAGGVRALTRRVSSEAQPLVRLANPEWQILDGDLILRGSIDWLAGDKFASSDADADPPFTD